MNVPNKTKGFTIIEVVLVLAIAGLIFLVVFLALPALQRGQRDNQRKQDLSKFMSQVQSYQSNNQGNLPSGTTAWEGFITNYLRTGGTPFADPQGGNYTPVVSTTGTNSPAPTAGQILIYAGSGSSGFKCDAANGGVTSAANSSRSFAAVIYQEQGGYYCQNN